MCGIHIPEKIGEFKLCCKKGKGNISKKIKYISTKERKKKNDQCNFKGRLFKAV